MDPGKRDRLVTFERATVTTDDHGGETLTWAELVQAWARVRYGTGQERREAAQERSDQVASFECIWTPTLATVAVTDRISFGGAWDITSAALVGLNREIHFTAVRSA
jgi:head-tail adaptor